MDAAGDIEAIYPLSPMQEGMLLESIHEEIAEAYFVQSVYAIHGELDTTAFKLAWKTVIRRHPVLRTAFMSRELDRMLQVVLREVEVPFLEEDWRALSGSDKHRRLEIYLAEDRRRGFAVTVPPLMRLTLIRTEDQQYQLVWSMHHALLDGWSTMLVFKEAAALYLAYSRGRELQLATPRPYSDYIKWLQAQDALKAEAYWKHRLAGFSAPTPLSGLEALTDGKQTAGAQGTLQKHLEMTFAGDVTANIETWAKKRRLTVSTLVQGAWALLLCKYSGETDVVFGATVSGRPPAIRGVESMVGLFINTIPVRTTIDLHQSVTEWLQQLQAAQVESREYEYAHLAQVQLWSEVARGRRLFDTLVVFENYLEDAFEDTYRSAAFKEVRNRGVRISQTGYSGELDYALSLLAGSGKQMSLQLHYDTRRFSDSAANAILVLVMENLRRLISADEQIIAEVMKPLSAEFRRTVEDWNRTEVDWNNEDFPSEAFEAQVRLQPDAIAVVDEQGQLTYSRLNASANHLAHRLTRLGVKPESRVGLYLERNARVVVGMLAVMKAGAAYLPMDPELPNERLAYMMEDGGVQVLVTQEKLKANLNSSRSVLLLDEDPEPVLPVDDIDLEGRAEKHNVAYVIYTSGSTGKPKGVEITYEGFANILNSVRKEPGIGRTDVVLALTTPSFDVAATELCLPMLAGARIVIASRDAARDAPMLNGILRSHSITVAQLTPSGWEALLLAGFTAGSGIKLLSAGEQLTTSTASRLASDGACVWNLYGPTETAIYSTCARAARSRHRPVESIGRPVANTRIYVLDDLMEPVAVGVPGEIYIGGRGVARGYWRRPALTSQRFVPDPFATGLRLYRTGDIGRWLGNGELEYLGRVDYQVKIRGYRVELGEIEAALLDCNGVTRAVAVVNEDSTASRRVIAYITGNADPGQTRRILRKRLPEYMTPAAVIALEEMPLTPNGKIDRTRLPEVKFESSLDEVQAPLTAIEEIVAGIWMRVLKLDTVGRAQDFFELGGHSLLAAQVISRVRETFQIELPVRTLFDVRTVAGLSEEVGRRRNQTIPPARPPLVRIRRDGPLPASFAQSRLWFLDRLEPELPTYNMPMTARLTGELDVVALESAVGELVRRHEVLRTRFLLQDGEPMQVIDDVAPWIVPLIDVSDLPGQDRQRAAFNICRLEAEEPFDLQRGPLLRTKLVKLSSSDFLFAATMHHIVSDGWSTGILLNEFVTLYEALQNGRVSPLADLTVQYADYAVWQREWLKGGVLDEQLAYWKRQLADLPPLEIPTDFARPSVGSPKGAAVFVHISRETIDKIFHLSRREGLTPFMTLLAAFQVVLGKWSGQQDFAIGIAIANRDVKETEGLIGLFVNELALRTNLNGNPTWRELLRRVRETTLDAYAHQDTPFDRVVEALQPERSLNRSPLFQVLMTLQNTPDNKAGSLEGLSYQPGPGGNVVQAKCDLTLILTEGPTGITGVLEYATEVYSAQTASRIVDHYVRVLDSIDLDALISETELMSDMERRLVLKAWNATDNVYPARCVHDLFAEQSRRTPDSVAVVYQSDHLTYRELNRRANQLSRHLRNAGIQLESRVGVMMNRSVEMIIAFLAVLKAGAAYVPLDPEYPKERLDTMLANSQAPAVITHASLRDQLSDKAAAKIYIEEDWGVICREADSNLPEEAFPDSVAYVMYTSGSTGRPKGVMITHRGIVRTVCDSGCAILDDRQIFLQFSSICFDLSTFEIWAALLNGAKLVLLTSGLPSLHELGQALAKHEINTLVLSTSLFHQVVEERLEDLQSIQQLLVAGEAMSISHTRTTKLGFRGNLINAYGPTETTTFSTFQIVDRVRPDDTSVPIGRPINNTVVYVLNDNMVPLGIGVPGELYIGGAGLARGYLGAPSVTADRFSPDPFSGHDGHRLYRTGDRVRWLHDGSLEFLGRLDDQVKIRGYRIELREIEAVLRDEEGVRQCSILVTESDLGEKLIKAFVTGAVDGRTLRKRLQSRLPRYMVPSYIIVLDTMPLNANGKIDRKALLRISAVETSHAAQLLPRDGTEVLLKDLWEDVLGVSNIGIQDNVFDLGAHSMSLLRLCSRLEEKYRVKISLRSIFQLQTIEQMAAYLRQEVALGPPTSVVPIHSRGSQPPFFCIHPGGGLIHAYTELANSLGPNQPFFGVQSVGFEEGEQPLRDIETMAAKYIVDMKTVQASGPYHLGGWSLGATVAYEVARQLIEAGEEVATLAFIDGDAPLFAEDSKMARIDEAEARILLSLLASGLNVPEEELLKVDEDARIERYLEYCRAMNLVSTDVSVRQFRRFLDLYVANKVALFKYRPRPCSVQAALFRVCQNGEANRPDYGWSALALGGVDVYEVPGSHNSLVTSPHVGHLAARLREYMDRMHLRNPGIRASSRSSI